MKILMLNHEYPPVGGGAAPVTLQLCKHLVRSGHEVDVVTMAYGDLPEHECCDGVNVYRTWAIRKKPNICYTHEMATYMPGAWRTVRRLCKSRNYDVVHCHFIIPGGLLAVPAAKFGKLPLLITCHGSDVPGYNPDRFGWTHKLILPVWRKLVRAADSIVSPSDWLRRLIIEKCPGAEVDVVPNGFDAADFVEREKDKSILMCSRLLPRKGFQYVIRAMEGMDLTGWSINLIGQGPYKGELETLAQQCGVDVKFHGWLDNTDVKFRELYERSRIFVFVSEAENFPTVLLEAASAGMAIITSTAGGCREVVGDAGILVEPSDVGAIRQKLKKLMADEQLCSQMGQRAKQRVQQFSWDNIARMYVEKYRSIMQK